MADYYSILLIDRNSTKLEIKESYKKMALKYHPDRNQEEGSEEHFKKISEAYQVLSDENKRKIYDSSGNIDFSFDDPLILFQKLFPNIPPEVVNIGCNIIKHIHENENFDINTIKQDKKLQDEIIELTDILTQQIPEPIKNIFNLLRKDIPRKTQVTHSDSLVSKPIDGIDSFEPKVNIELPDMIKDIDCVDDVINREMELTGDEYGENNLDIPIIGNLKTVECVNEITNDGMELTKTEYSDIDLDIEHEINVELEDMVNNSDINTSLMVLRYCDNLELDCKICSGKGYYLVKKHFKIPTRYRNIQLLNEGHHNESGKGNLFIKLNIITHPKYRIINDYDLVSEIDVTVYDLHFGTTIYLPYFEKNIGLRISRELKNTSMTKCIEELGLPKKNGRGKLYIEMNLIFPDNMRDDIIEKYFPQISNYYDDLDINKTLEIYRI